VFVESITYLPVVRPEQWSAADRRRLRRAVGLVGRYSGGRRTEWQWRAALRGVDILQQVAGTGVALSALDRLRRLQARSDDPTRSERSSAGASRTTAGYDEMRAALLTHYGRAIATHRRDEHRTALRDVVRRCLPVDRATAAAVRDVAAAGVEVALVTDMPTTVAEAFVTEALDCPVRAVAATRFDTDATGRFTGDFHAVDKASALRQFREEFGWEHVVAVGDTARDLTMRPAADQFVAVGGRGQIRAHLQPPHVTAGESGAETLQAAETVYVPRAVPLGDVLRTVLSPRGGPARRS
jgi:phosphoserine phosphatase